MNQLLLLLFLIEREKKPGCWFACSCFTRHGWSQQRQAANGFRQVVGHHWSKPICNWPSCHQGFVLPFAFTTDAWKGLENTIQKDLNNSIHAACQQEASCNDLCLIILLKIPSLKIVKELWSKWIAFIQQDWLSSFRLSKTNFLQVRWNFDCCGSVFLFVVFCGSDLIVAWGLVDWHSLPCSGHTGVCCTHRKKCAVMDSLALVKGDGQNVFLSSSIALVLDTILPDPEQFCWTAGLLQLQVSSIAASFSSLSLMLLWEHVLWALPRLDPSNGGCSWGGAFNHGKCH